MQKDKNPRVDPGTPAIAFPLTGNRRRDRTLLILVSGIVVNLVLLTILAVNVYEVRETFYARISNNVKVERLTGRLVLYDEILTMSIRDYALTGDEQWVTRYNKYAKAYDPLLAELTAEVPDIFGTPTAVVKASGDKLFAFEAQALEQVAADDRVAAIRTLESTEYLENKEIYAAASNAQTSHVQQQMDINSENFRQLLRNLVVLLSTLFPVMVVIWAVVIRAVRRDLLRRQHDEEHIHALNDDLVSKNLQLEDFAFSTAHTLKTDWLGVGYLVEELVEIMKEEGVAEGGESLALMAELQVRVPRGVHTVDALLKYTMLSAGIEKTPQSVLDVVKSVVAGVNDPRLSIDPDFKDAVWPLDKAKFSIALQEIIANALAYGRGKPVEILFNGEELRIRDHGRGIPKDSLIEIFGLFRRATTESTGAGIGLAITKQIVFAHGYRIWAQSAGDDQGSTFIIDFTPETPVQEQEASQRV